jgi:hypothetical protein
MGLDDDGHYEKALGAYRRASGSGSANWGALDDCAKLMRKLGDFAGSAGAYAKALPLAGSEAEGVKRDLAAVKAILDAPAWVRKLEAGAAAVESGAMLRGRELLERGFEGAEGAEEGTLDRHGDSLASAHYGYASCLAAASEGRTAPLAPAQPVAPDEASGLRRMAVEHLQKSVDFGFDEPEALEEDTDLDPVRDSLEFKGLLARLRGEGR